MLTLKTLEEYRQEYSEKWEQIMLGIDDDTRALIEHYFDNRYIVHNFTEFFNRRLAVDYPIYKQLLRVDPTMAKYDWFVEEYLETEEENRHEGSKTDKSDSSYAKNGSLTQGSYSETQYDGSEATVNSGEDTDRRYGSYTDNLHRSGDKQYIGTESTTESGKEKNNEVHSLSGYNANRGIQHQRNNPMSASYTGDASIGTNQNVSARSGNLNVVANANNIGNDIHMPKITNPTLSSDGLTQGTNAEAGSNTSERSFEGRKSERAFGADRKDHDDFHDDRTVEYGNKDQTNTGLFDETSHGHVINSVQGKRYNAKTGAYTDDPRKDTTNGGMTNATTDSGTSINSGNSSDKSKDNRKLIHRGRHELPSSIILQARDAITKTSAWKWLYSELTKSFLMIYVSRETTEEVW